MKKRDYFPNFNARYVFIVFIFLAFLSVFSLFFEIKCNEFCQCIVHPGMGYQLNFSPNQMKENGNSDCCHQNGQSLAQTGFLTDIRKTLSDWLALSYSLFAQSIIRQESVLKPCLNSKIIPLSELNSDTDSLAKEHCGVDVPSPQAPHAVETTVKPSPGPRIPFITNKSIEDLGVIKYPVLPILKKTKEWFIFSSWAPIEKYLNGFQTYA